jgi:hypothetical protein
LGPCVRLSQDSLQRSWEGLQSIKWTQQWIVTFVQRALAYAGLSIAEL